MQQVTHRALPSRPIQRITRPNACLQRGLTELPVAIAAVSSVVVVSTTAQVNGVDPGCEEGGPIQRRGAAGKEQEEGKEDLHG